MQFVDEHKDEHGVEPIIAALEGTCAQIAPSTYYAARSRLASARAISDVGTTARIREVHVKKYRGYGAREVWKELGRERDSRVAAATVTAAPGGDRSLILADPVVVPPPVARCTVERLMRVAGSRGVSAAKGLFINEGVALGERVSARRCQGEGRGLPKMEVLTLPIRKTSTCLTLPSVTLI